MTIRLHVFSQTCLFTPSTNSWYLAAKKLTYIIKFCFSRKKNGIPPICLIFASSTWLQYEKKGHQVLEPWIHHPAENTNEGHMFRHKSAETSKREHWHVKGKHTHVHHKVGPYLLLL